LPWDVIYKRPEDSTGCTGHSTQLFGFAGFVCSDKELLLLLDAVVGHIFCIGRLGQNRNHCIMRWNGTTVES
jgi:hypothetical protein